MGEVSAYRALARLLRCPPDDVDAAIKANAITMTTHRVMAAVFDGDPHPIYNIILDENADEFVRSRMCRRWPCWLLQGRLDRAEAASFLGDCWINLQPRDYCFVWHGWQSAIALLGLVELKDIVKEAFDREIIDPSWLDYSGLRARSRTRAPEPDGAMGAQPPRIRVVRRYDRGAVHLVLLLGKVQAGARESAQRAVGAAVPPSEPPGIFARRRPQRSMPCGSGKKYKKCCLLEPRGMRGGAFSRIRDPQDLHSISTPPLHSSHGSV